MKITHRLSLAVFILFLFMIPACAVEISQTQNVPTRPPATPTEIPPPTSTPTVPPTETPTLIPTATQPGDPTLTPTSSPTPTSAFGFSTVPSTEFDLQVLPNMPENLQGRMLFLITLDDGLQAFGAFDLNTREVSTLFIAPPKAWLLAQSYSLHSNEILLSYAPPPAEGKVSYGYTDLYLLKPDGSLTPVLQRADDIEAYFGAFFSPAGDMIYYSHFLADSTAQSGFRYHVNRFGYPGGSPEVVVEDAFWERLSPDGSKLAYVTFDGREFDELFVANADGSDPVRVLDPDEFPTVDAPFFSPDNQFLYFSAVSESTTPLTWWEKLIGVRIAFAHAVPSDFWQVSLTDGTVKQITHLQDQGMYGTFSPDGTLIAFTSSTGLYVMNPDGNDLVQVIESNSLYGTLDWIP